jgi:hypothetical protein
MSVLQLQDCKQSTGNKTALTERNLRPGIQGRYAHRSEPTRPTGAEGRRSWRTGFGITGSVETDTRCIDDELKTPPATLMVRRRRVVETL